MDRPRKTPARPARNGLVLSSGAFARISAVEGIRLTAESERMFEEFDRRGLSDTERRRAILKKHARKTGTERERQ